MQLHLALRPHVDVPGIDVAVDDAERIVVHVRQRVRVVQRLRELRADIEGEGLGDGASARHARAHQRVQ